MALINQTPQAYYNGSDYGNYQFVSLADIINQFMLVYVGEDKLISKAKRVDVVFHAQRALAELSFDTLKSFKSQELTLPPSLQVKLPQDYVNYTDIFWVDSAGIKHPIYPTRHTQNPVEAPLQDGNGEFKLEKTGTTTSGSNSIVMSERVENILPGMLVTGLYIPGYLTGDKMVVESVLHSTSATTITVVNTAGAGVNSTQSGVILLQFENAETTVTTVGSLILPDNATHVVDNLDWNTTDYKISADAASDIASLEVGMLVYHQRFAIGTKIVAIDGATIFVDNVPTISVNPNSEQVVFVDPNKDTKTWSKYKSSNPSEHEEYNYDYDDEVLNANLGGRYGLDPTISQVNGSFYIDEVRGLIHFSSNLGSQCIVLDYISDGLGTEDEMQVHKFAEEAMYRYLLHAIASGKINTPEYMVQRLKKEKFAAIRNAKLRLSNLKLEELTQVLRGKSKWIKH
tara:strand:+ start:4630 stop:6000 length:1371 start_codon:yes stop_codon:yes gene_type:complete